MSCDHLREEHPDLKFFVFIRNNRQRTRYHVRRGQAGVCLMLLGGRVTLDGPKTTIAVSERGLLGRYTYFYVLLLINEVMWCFICVSRS